MYTVVRMFDLAAPLTAVTVRHREEERDKSVT